MGRNNYKTFFWGKEALINHLGQLIFKRRFISKQTQQFYRFILPSAAKKATPVKRAP